jgi:hypothetical protein
MCSKDAWMVSRLSGAVVAGPSKWIGIRIPPLAVLRLSITSGEVLTRIFGEVIKNQGERMNPTLIIYKGQPAIVTGTGETGAHLNIFTDHGLVLEHNADISDSPVLVSLSGTQPEQIFSEKSKPDAKGKGKKSKEEAAG